METAAIWITVIVVILVLVVIGLLMWYLWLEPMMKSNNQTPQGILQQIQQQITGKPASSQVANGQAVATQQAQPVSAFTEAVAAGAPIGTTSENPELSRANPVFANWNTKDFLPQPGSLGPDAPTWEELTYGRELVNDPKAFLQASAAARGTLQRPSVRPKWHSTDTRPFPAIKQVPMAFNNPDITEADVQLMNNGAEAFYCHNS